MTIVKKIKEVSNSRAARSLFLMQIRALSLLVKFLLTIYIVRFLSLEDLGLYGLIVAGTLVVPACLGLSLMYTISRKAITQSTEELAKNLFNYGRYNACIYTLIFLIAVGVGLVTGKLSFVLLLCAVLFFEHMNHDFYNLLLNLSKPFSANILHTIRTSVWILLYMVWAYFVPSLRNIETLLIFWVIGSACAFVCFFKVMRIREWDFKINAEPFICWLKREFWETRIIYINVLAQTGFQYFDRYLISFFLGLELTGVYVLFLQVNSALYNLLNTGIIQVSRPKMVSAYKNQEPGYKNIYINCRRNVFFVATVLAVAATIFVYLVLPYLDKPLVTEWFPVLYIIMFSSVFQAQHGVQGLVFYSQHREDLILKINMILFPVMVACYVAFIPAFGLWGAATCLVVFVTLKLFLQYKYVARLL